MVGKPTPKISEAFMAKSFRPSTREARILSEIESSREYKKRKAISNVRNCIEPLSNALAMKLVENNLVETTSKEGIEEQLAKCLEKLCAADDFDIDYQIAPIRRLVQKPNVVSLYVTAFVLEQLINHKDVIDIYGSDDEIYDCVNAQILKFLE